LKSYVQSKFNHLKQLTNLDTISNQTYMTINVIINRKHNTHDLNNWIGIAINWSKWNCFNL